MNRYCDQYATCNSVVIDRGAEATDDQLRARGWHIWRGFTMGQVYTYVVLCDKCCQTRRREAAEVLIGQIELELEL